MLPIFITILPEHTPVKKTYCRENFERNFSGSIYREGAKTLKTLHLKVHTVPPNQSHDGTLRDRISKPNFQTGRQYSCEGTYDGIKFGLTLKVN